MPTRSIHVFASDAIRLSGCARTAGSIRSAQIVAALEAAGHRVSVSYDLNTHLARTCEAVIRATLSAEDLWACEHFTEPNVVLNRIRPEIAIYCNINAFRPIWRLAGDVIHVVDLYGPAHLEKLTMLTDAGPEPPSAELVSRQLVEYLRSADYVMTVSERQKYFWLAYCSMAGFGPGDLRALVCPFRVDVRGGPERRPDPFPTIIHAGSFYPWQNPAPFLRAAASFLDAFPGAKLHVAGGPHEGLPNAGAVKDFLRELQGHPSVAYHGFIPAEELAALLARSWVALDLMPWTLERELAVYGRTLEYLAGGTPVIHNDYSSLAPLIRQYGAGWSIPADPTDPAALTGVLGEVVQGGIALAEELSANACRLARAELDGADAMQPLLDLCASAGKRRAARSGAAAREAKAAPTGRVLAITRSLDAVAELRLANPLRAAREAGAIRDFRITGDSLQELASDASLYDAIVIQRAVDENVYLTLADLGRPYLLDVDDNLLARAAYRQGGADQSLAPGLVHAASVTAPTPRLIQLLEKYSGVTLGGRAFIVPNALPYARALDAPVPPSRIVWIQSDIAALTTSRDAVVRAVEDFSSRCGLPVMLIGRNVLRRARFTHQVVLGEIDFESNLRLLETAPTSIGVAPLETMADEQTLDFVAGKSDLKILLFAGYGHPAVVSASPPYTESPFHDAAYIAGNSYGEWSDALEFQYREGWKSIGDHARRIQRARHLDAVVKESWAPALASVVMPQPISGAELRGAFLAFGERRRLASRESTAEPDPSPAMADALQAEIAALRNSLSWKITAPLRAIARPLMKKR